MILIARGVAERARRRSFRRAAATSRAARPMRSPQSNAMGPRAGAGWPSSESAAATPGVVRATTPYREDLNQVNDSKNLILAVVLSALVLLGWTWAANHYFPTANPPSTQDRSGKQQPVPQPSAQPAGRRHAQGAAERLQRRSPRARASRIRTPSLSGSINLKGARDRRSAAAQPAPDDRQEFAAGAAAVAARSAGRLYRAVRLDRAGRPGARARRGVDGGQPAADAGPSRHAERRRRRTAPAIRSRSRSTTAISSPSSRASSTVPASRSSSGRSGSSAAPASRPTSRCGRTTSGRSACSTARPITDVNWKDLDAGQGRERSTMLPAGSASPTNIG